MAKIELRVMKISDAKRFYEILTNPKFIHFGVRPKSVEAEKKWIRTARKKIKDNFAYDYAILYDKKVVGGCGIKIDQHRKFIGEIGYFIDEEYWGKGIATKAVKLLEKIGFGKLKLKRITIVMDPRNPASEKVAKKVGYKKEGFMKKAVISRNAKYEDVYLYAKTR